MGPQGMTYPRPSIKFNGNSSLGSKVYISYSDR